MTTIVRWDPYREMHAFQDHLGRVFHDFLSRGSRSDDDSISASWLPAVDVRESAEALELHAELPGIDPNDVQISVEGSVLTIRGTRNFERAAEGETYHRVERSYGAFERTFTLPSNVDAAKIKAVYRLGVLHLNLPKREESKPRSISIKVEEK